MNEAHEAGVESVDKATPGSTARFPPSYNLSIKEKSRECFYYKVLLIMTALAFLRKMSVRRPLTHGFKSLIGRGAEKRLLMILKTRRVILSNEALDSNCRVTSLKRLQNHSLEPTAQRELREQQASRITSPYNAIKP